MMEDPESDRFASESKHVFHFVIAYGGEENQVPVIIRQSLIAVEDQTTHSEMWATRVERGLSVDEVRMTINRRPFWTQEKHRSKFQSHEAKTEAYEGKFYELLLHTHRRINILAVLLDDDDREDMVLDTVSLLQISHVKNCISDPFAEICLSLRQAEVSLESAGSLETEDHVNIRRGDDQADSNVETAQELRALGEMLDELRTPWEGLNLDFDSIPTLHMVAQAALQVTDTYDGDLDRIHIFTDGSANSHTAAWAFTVLAEKRTHEQVTFLKVGYAAALVDDSVGPFQPCAQMLKQLRSSQWQSMP